MLAVGQALVSWKWLPVDALAMGLSYTVGDQIKNMDDQLYRLFLQCHRAALCDPDQSPFIRDCEKGIPEGKKSVDITYKIGTLEEKKSVNITYTPECRPPCTAPNCLTIWTAARAMEESYIGTAYHLAYWVFEAAKWHTAMVLAKQIYGASIRMLPAEYQR